MENKPVLSEYPRPQMRRDSYLCLNGLWDFRMDEYAGDYTEKILVPYAPETPRSGVGREKQPGETLFYRRFFTLPEGFHKGRVLLHFGAADLEAEVSVNGLQAGSHRGGYFPFSFDITELLVAGENELKVRVTDEGAGNHLDARGKQSGKPGNIWYPASSGLWQTVWLESVPEDYIVSVETEPLFDESAVLMTVRTSREDACEIVLDGMTFAAAGGHPVHIPVPDFIPWTPENPHLYRFTARFGSDSVEGYFGMRKISAGPDKNGTPRIMLNNRPYFCTGLLDQGYYEGGYYTPGSMEEMAHGIRAAKALGFNTLRKHAKVEPLLWYHLCDTLGMLVWQDIVNGGGPYRKALTTLPVLLPLKRRDSRYKAFGRETKKSRRLYYRELEDTVSLLKNSPSVVLYTAFNEGWGQFDALKAAEKLRKLDSSRLVDHASGWYDQGGGDIVSRHVYFLPPRISARKGETRPLCLTEFGGFSLAPGGEKKGFGYRRFHTEEELTRAIVRLYRRYVIPNKPEGLSAAIYTQLSDCFQEDNGLLTAQGELKVSADALRRLNRKLSERVDT